MRQPPVAISGNRRIIKHFNEFRPVVQARGQPEETVRGDTIPAVKSDQNAAQAVSAGEEGATEPMVRLLAAAEAILPWMIEIRRDLHRHPELGLEEHRTAAKVCEHLDTIGIPYVSGIGESGTENGTGVIGTLAGQAAAEGRLGVAALRADLDALPLQDGKDAPYRSTYDGRMHACGHDVHTAILLGASRLLHERRDSFSGLVKLLFQPAEETVGGARFLIEAGALSDPPVDAIFGLHVDPGLDVGRFGLHYGQRNASSDNLQVVVRGRSGHGAYPSGSVDAIVVAAQVITALQSVVSRNVDARNAAVVTLGTIAGGTQRNIICNEVTLVGTVRCLDRSTRELVLRRIRETAQGVASGFGAQAEVEIQPSYDPVINDNDSVDLVRANADDLVGTNNVVIFDRPNMGVEDFGFYLTHVPGAFFSMGVRNEERGIVHPVHNELFDADERAMAYGAALQVANALRVVGG